jgi:EAL domain-containing protein (putative c-di-GMP-specific phosphodiesterase class I)
MVDGEVEQMLKALYGAISASPGPDGQPNRWTARHGPHQLTSAFQPIYSFPHRRPVGYEALVRVSDLHGRSVSPVAAFEGVASFEDQVRLDRLCRLLHVHNFVTQGPPDCWLFLNIHPAVFLQAAREHDLLSGAVDTVHHLGLPTQRLVLEVTEDVMARDQCFEAAVEAARATGCLLALDDFGVGHSNFDRIWRIRPEIVKLDRSLLQHARGSRRMARVMAQMVSLLHECGALVLLEGVESREDAQLAMDADVDLVQGFAFAHPNPDVLMDSGVSEELEGVWSLFSERHAQVRRDYDEQLAPFRNALALALQPLQQGQGLAVACAPFLRLAGSQMCYLLDEEGRELGARAASPDAPTHDDVRFLPMERAGDARWARRPYFRRAVESVGEIQVTRPYLSLRGAKLCITVSVAYWTSGRLRVLCGDLDWGQA